MQDSTRRTLRWWLWCLRVIELSRTRWSALARAGSLHKGIFSPFARVLICHLKRFITTAAPHLHLRCPKKSLVIEPISRNQTSLNSRGRSTHSIGHSQRHGSNHPRARFPINFYVKSCFCAFRSASCWGDDNRWLVNHCKDTGVPQHSIRLG